MAHQHVVFDTELIGKEKPHFLICCKILETGEVFKFWHHKRGHTRKLLAMLENPDYTWIGFNSENFDRPLIAMAVMGYDERALKTVAQAIIDNGMRSWQTYREYSIEFLEYDHIDLQEVPPGVMISLKLYAARLHRKNLIDMPFHHDHELVGKDFKVVENYCLSDISATEDLYLKCKGDIELRVELGETYDVDLRSKSEAQCAEAILKKVCGIANKDKIVPNHVRYTTPGFIKTLSPMINEIIEMCETHAYKINHGNGSPEFPEFLVEPINIGGGVYQMGNGGLHSQHDQQLHLVADEKRLLSDFDVASYYPNIMMTAGLIPNLGGNKGQLFLEAYRDIYEQRIAAKRSGDKATANTLKIVLNGTFGKLGSIFCSFYAPELMLAVTITGQINLLCLIHELNKIKGVRVESANTDGILVNYPETAREKVLKVFYNNAKRTAFEYEETPYRVVGMKDVNNYYAVTEEADAAVITKAGIQYERCKGGKVKRKGLYAISGVHENKNPTMEVCSDAVAAYLAEGVEIEDYIRSVNDISKFIAVRNVSGGGVQHVCEVEVDDWVLVEDNGNASNIWMRQKHLDQGKSLDDQGGAPHVKRKSRPKPILEGRGGTPFGRVARWYMTTKPMPAITSVKTGSTVPKTTGARLCLELPDRLPDDLNYHWYIEEARSILTDVGVEQS